MWYFVIKLGVIAQGSICSLLKEINEWKIFISISLFFFPLFLSGVMVYWKGPWSSNLGGVGNHQVIVVTQGADKTEVGTLWPTYPAIEDVLENTFVAIKSENNKEKVGREVFVSESKLI